MSAAVESGPSAIALKNVSISIARTPIVDDVSLDVRTGEWVTVIGPNGAGKSTLLRAVAGLLPATGSISLFGTRLTRMRRRDRARIVAVVPQAPVIPPGMTVFDYVLLGRTPYIPTLGRESPGDVAAVHELLGRLDLDAFAGRGLATLSGGERQRVVLARALAQGGSLLLLDEPTTALDLGHQQEVLDLVDRLRHDRGLTVLSIAHDLSIAGEYADRMVLLAGGRVVSSGTPAEVLTEETISTHYRVRVRVVAGEHGPLIVPVRGAVG